MANAYLVCQYVQDCYNFKGNVADGEALKTQAVSACKVSAELEP